MKLDFNAFKKPFIIALAGMGLQLVGIVVLATAALSAAKEINTQIKKLLVQKLSEEA